MTENVEILTKVYGFVNRIKVCLAFSDILGAWKVVNELSEYLVSVDCAPTPRALDGDTVATVCTCNPVGGIHAAFCPCDRPRQ